MNLADVLEPTFSQPDVLEVTGVSAVTLQTWVNRRLIELAEQHPGTGRRRRYRLVDVARLAIMQQLTALHIGPSTAKAIAEEVTEGMASGRTWAADIVFVVSAPGPDPIIIRAEDEPKEPGHRGRVLVVGDPADVSVWNFDPSESELSGPDVDQARRRVALLETKMALIAACHFTPERFKPLPACPSATVPFFADPMAALMQLDVMVADRSRLASRLRAVAPVSLISHRMIVATLGPLGSTAKPGT